MAVGVGAAATWLGVMATPALGASQLAPTQMSLYPSAETTVGLQVFANANLMGGPSPTGTVVFKLFGPDDLSCSSAVFTSAVPVGGPSVNSAPFTTSQAGTYRWEAAYSGDSANGPAGPTACEQPSAVVKVLPRYTGFAIHADAPTAGTIYAAASLGGDAPTGSITFMLTPPGDTFCSGTPIFTSTVPVSAAGNYTSAAFTPTVTGTYKWRATYSGDNNNYPGQVTPCLDQNAAVTVTTVDGVNPPPPPPPLVTPGTSLVAAANPVSYGQTISITSHLTGPSATPTGSVTLADGTAILGSAHLNGGLASFNLTLPVGTHHLDAIYTGDSAFLPATATLTETVQQAATQLMGAPASKASGSFSATLTQTGTNALLAGQTVTFWTDGIFGSAEQLCSAVTGSNGVATCTSTLAWDAELFASSY
nr:Ig-like domain-containing protein [Actinomycetota bacterium]